MTVIVKLHLLCGLQTASLICETEPFEIYFPNGSHHKLIAYYLGLYEKGEVKRINNLTRQCLELSPCMLCNRPEVSKRVKLYMQRHTCFTFSSIYHPNSCNSRTLNTTDMLEFIIPHGMQLQCDLTHLVINQMLANEIILTALIEYHMPFKGFLLRQVLLKVLL